MKIFERIDDNLDKLNKSEKEQVFLELAIYQARKNNKKDEKLKTEREYLESTAKFYNQSVAKMMQNIEVNMNLYTVLLNKLMYIYDTTFTNFIKVKQSALNYQKILICNVIYFSQNYNDEKNADNEEYKNNLYQNIESQLQSKINFEVIINECDARINWLIDDMEKSFDKIFIDKNKALIAIDANSFWFNFAKRVRNLFVGRRKYKEFNDSYINYINYLLKKIEKKENELAGIYVAMEKQMKLAKNQILKELKTD